MIKISRGWKEALSALVFGLFILLGIALIMSLGGCTGTKLLAEYEHHSSIPDYYDLATSDIVGGCLNMPARLHLDDCGDYCPELEACVSWEVTGTPVFGRDPVGTLRLRQPIWIKK